MSYLLEKVMQSDLTSFAFIHSTRSVCSIVSDVERVDDQSCDTRPSPLRPHLHLLPPGGRSFAFRKANLSSSCSRRTTTDYSVDSCAY